MPIPRRMANIDAVVAAGYKDVVIFPMPQVQNAPFIIGPWKADTSRLVATINSMMALAVAEKQLSYDSAPAGSSEAGAKLWLLSDIGGCTSPFPQQSSKSVAALRMCDPSVLHELACLCSGGQCDWVLADTRSSEVGDWWLVKGGAGTAFRFGSRRCAF